MIAENVSLAGPLVLVPADGGQAPVDLLQLLPSPPARPEVCPGELVEGSPLGGGREQGLLVVLAVDVNELFPGFGQGSDRDHPTVDPGPRASTGRDRAGQYDLYVPLSSRSLQALFARLVTHAVHTVQAGYHEPGLHHGFFGPGPHQAGRGPPTQHQLEGLDQQRLTGAGLTGERGHPWPEPQGEVLDRPRGRVPAAPSARVSPPGQGPGSGRRSPANPRSPIETKRTGSGATRQDDLGPGGEPSDLAAVDHQHRRPPAQHPDGDHLVGLEHQAAIEGEVGRHRREDHGPQSRGATTGPPADRL